MKRLLILSFLAALLTACDFSLAGDIIPPPDAIISADATLAPVAAPVSAPDLAAGAEIYANRCAPCHGASGLGDGEQAAQLPLFPSAIGDPDLARSSSPEAWYRVINAGRIQRFMPPFGSALSEQQRWDVLSYVYTLGWDDEILARGEAVYRRHQGDVDDLLEDVALIGIEQELLTALDLPSDDVMALTAYLQALALGIVGTETQTVEDQPAPDVESTSILGAFHGEVIYGSGDQLPSGLQARLYGFDHTDQVVSEIAEVTEDGSFSFGGIPLADGRVFFIQVDYEELSFFSEFLTSDGQAGSVELDVPIYDSTTDTSQLAVERLQFFFDFPKVGVIRLVEAVTISNLGDRAVAPDESGQPPLHFSLPPQASNLAFDEGELGSRYIPDETGFGDTRAVIPGLHSREMYFSYELPYNAHLELSLPVDLATRMVVALVPEDFELMSDGLQLQGKQDVEGANYLVYSGIVGYSPGDDIPIAISGQHPLGSNGAGLLTDDTLVIGLAALTAAVGFAWLWFRRLPLTDSWDAESIMAEIVALDQRYEKRRIAKAAYTKTRAKLKDRLKRILDR